MLLSRAGRLVFPLVAIFFLFCTSDKKSTVKLVRVTVPEATKVAAPYRASLIEAYGKFPMSFEPNEGQAGTSVKFLARGSGYNVFLTSTEAVLAISKTAKGRWSSESAERAESANARSAVVLMRLDGANPASEVMGIDELEGKTNYFLGNDPEQWRTNIPTYKKVRYRSVYSGIDLVYYGSGGQLEYDFIVTPGADPERIRLHLEGAEEVVIDEQGNLVLRAGRDEILLLQPSVYQEVAGNRRHVACRYALMGKNEVVFRVGDFDPFEPLIIDPVLTYSTYLGGSSDDYGNGIAVDARGNAYVTGYTYSNNFPTVNPIEGTAPFVGGAFSYAFVSKFNSTGSALLYSTYLGGVGVNESTGIAVDAAGEAYITGSTSSTNFPTANAHQPTYGGQTDAFVAKLDSTGSGLIYSTYLGGNSADYGNAIALDASGNAYITGSSVSTNFPTVNAVQSIPGGGADVFVSKFSSNGSALLYSTYLGGSGYDEGRGIAVDASGDAYVTGISESEDFPTAHALQPTSPGGGHDAFVSKFDSTGSVLLYSTYLGGSFDDDGNDIVVDASGNAYVTGSTDSMDFPTVNAFQRTPLPSYQTHAFVCKFNASGSALLYSTYLGGNGNDFGNGIAVDPSANAYVTGSTTSTNFPTPNGLQRTSGGNYDGFVSKFNAAGSALLFSTYMGGSANDFGSRIVADASGNAYLTGYTGSTNFPKANSFQSTFAGGSYDAFVAVIDTLKKGRGQITSQ
jgi:hypothetical protein